MSYLFQEEYFRGIVNTSTTDNRIGNPAIVEKDYYVTEALRLICQDFGDVVIFKGGTSLSKGWNLIDRFSEDIDLYVKPLDSEAETLERFQHIADRVASFPGFTKRSGKSDKGSSSWTEEFFYESQVDAIGGIRPVVLLEAGIQSADQPTETRNLISIIADSLDLWETETGTEDREPFPMQLLHFRRTFVEKLFTLHSRVERAIRQNRDLGRDARHYYDLSMLLDRPETQNMLNSFEYAFICTEYRELTAKFYPGQVKLLPEGMNLAESPALFPAQELRGKLRAAYIREADTLCYGPYPPFEEILQGFEGIRNCLRTDV